MSRHLKIKKPNKVPIIVKPHDSVPESFIKRHELRIKYILQIITALLSIISIFMSIINYKEVHYKNELEYEKIDGLKIERLVYDYDTQSFRNDNVMTANSELMYSLTSIDNPNKYSNVKITPILHIYLKDKESLILDSQFIYLDKLYIDCTAQSISSITAFMDYRYSENTLDDFLRYYTRGYNHLENDIFADADIVYKVNYTYLNNRNEYQNDEVFLCRDSDFVNLLSKKKLLIDLNFSSLFQNALNENNVHSLEVFSELEIVGYNNETACLKDPNDEVINRIISECHRIITDFQNKHGLIEFYYEHQTALS